MNKKNKSLPEICSQGIGNFFQFAVAMRNLNGGWNVDFGLQGTSPIFPQQ